MALMLQAARLSRDAKRLFGGGPEVTSRSAAFAFKHGGFASRLLLAAQIADYNLGGLHSALPMGQLTSSTQILPETRLFSKFALSSFSVGCRQ